MDDWSIKIILLIMFEIDMNGYHAQTAEQNGLGTHLEYSLLFGMTGKNGTDMFIMFKQVWNCVNLYLLIIMSAPTMKIRKFRCSHEIENFLLPHTVGYNQILCNDCMLYNVVIQSECSTIDVYFTMGVRRYNCVFLNLTYSCRSCYFLSLEIEFYTDNNTILRKATLI